MTPAGGKLVAGSMADSMSSVEEDDNSLDGANGNRRQHLDYGSVYQSTTIPKVETKLRRKSSVRPSYDTDDLLNLLHGSDPVRLELTRLDNEVRGKTTGRTYKRAYVRSEQWQRFLHQIRPQEAHKELSVSHSFSQIIEANRSLTLTQDGEDQWPSPTITMTMLNTALHAHPSPFSVSCFPFWTGGPATLGRPDLPENQGLQSTAVQNCNKDRELGEAQAEIKALRLSDRLKQKAVDELSEELEKVDDKLKTTLVFLENKNLEVKKINDERKAALAAQFAAEATLRRVHAAQKDSDLPPIEAILAPLEAELKLARQEVAKLQENNRALDRLTKTKEAALLEAERTVQAAEAKASMVDDLQNRNQELLKQIEICQEENKILDKMHRNKVCEVEKLSRTVHDLEEAVLAGGAAVNAARDYQRQVHELLEGKRTLERELARAKISANRVASVVANDWKDANDKVMPVKQWLEERRFLQGEMQQLRDKLVSAEKTAKNESQLKEKLQLRLKVLEEGVRSGTGTGTGTVTGLVRRSTAEPKRSSSVTTNGSMRQSSGTEEGARVLANGSRTRRSAVAQLRASMSSSTLLKNGRMTSKSFDGGRSFDGGSSPRVKAFTNGFEELRSGRKSSTDVAESPAPASPKPEKTSEVAKEKAESTAPKAESTAPKAESTALAAESENDTVSGVLYDMLQKEVISLRKAMHEKDQSLKDKDDAIEMLSKKVDTLSKAMEVEAKKMRREVIVMEKEVAAMRVDKDQDRRTRRLSMSKEPVNSSSQRLSGRSVRSP